MSPLLSVSFADRFTIDVRRRGRRYFTDCRVRKVLAYRLLATNTVEEHVAQMQVEKRTLAEAVLSGEQSGLRSLTRKDVEWLLR